MKILLAVDGSKHGRWATEWIAQIPFAAMPQVKAVHVLDLLALKSPFMVQPAIAGSQHLIQQEVVRLQKRAKRVVAETTERLSTLPVQGKVKMVRGPAAETILAQAPRHKGLVILGSRGLSPIDRFMLGGVSMRVATHATCSTLLIKQPPRPLRSALLAIDGSKSSEKAVQFLMREVKPEQNGAPLDILVMHVIPFLRYPELKEAARALVQDAADRLAKAGFRVTEIVQLGDPVDQIMKVAARHKADLIVTGAKGLGAVARFFLGSVSMKLVQHSDQSVLVVR